MNNDRLGRGFTLAAVVGCLSLVTACDAGPEDVDEDFPADEAEELGTSQQAICFSDSASWDFDPNNPDHEGSHIDDMDGDTNGEFWPAELTDSAYGYGHCNGYATRFDDADRVSVRPRYGITNETDCRDTYIQFAYTWRSASYSQASTSGWAAYTAYGSQQGQWLCPGLFCYCSLTKTVDPSAESDIYLEARGTTGSDKIELLFEGFD